MPSGFVTAMLRTPPREAAPKTTLPFVHLRPATPIEPDSGSPHRLAGSYDGTSMQLLSLWGILDRRQPWAFRFQRAEVRTKRRASIRPTSSVPSGIDHHRRRLPLYGPNPSDLIPL